MATKPSRPRKKKASTRRAPAKKSTGARRKRRTGFSLRGLLPTRRSLLIMAARMTVAGIIIGGLAVMYFAQNLPDISAIDTIRKQQGITIEAEDGRTIANYGDVYGEYLNYEELPKTLIHAVVATEDRRFFEHHGVDVFGIMRAVVINVRKGHLVQGGSTITQQVAKNVFLTPERSISRKIQEMLLAFWLEARFSKKQIMAIYLNRVYLGAGTFGVDAAAKRYFNKSARDLNLSESALLAGLLKAPSRYSPAANSERARNRMHQVLLNMVDAGYLKEAQVKLALANYAEATEQRVEGGNVRYFTDWVLDEVPNYVGQVDEDMIITTTLDPDLQTKAQDALEQVITKEGVEKKVTQGAIVSMKPDGAVQAMIGGISYAKSQYNRVSQAKRQPGSVFKLFVYLAALEAGMTPQSLVEDAPVTLQVGKKTWSPENYAHGKYRGEIPMVEALRHSLNTVSVRLSQYAGIDRVASIAMRLGIPNVPEHPSIALGAVEATLLEMTGAYAHLANYGTKVVPYGITRIRTRAGVELYKREDRVPSTVLASGTVEMMNYMLLDVVQHGTGLRASLGGRPAAGKTGTSQNFKDAWFIGFTPRLVTGVWVGNDNNTPMKHVTGGSLPAAIWHNFMVEALKGKTVLSIPNSASSLEGLLPWLFGSGHDEIPVAPSLGDVPEDTPAGYTAEPRLVPTRQVPDRLAPLPEQDPAPVIQESSPRPAPHHQDALPPQFWDKLMKE